MRALNANLILKLIWKEKSISRAEIARLTGLARSTVSEIVGQLLDHGLILEIGTAKSEIGRRPIMLVFNYDAFGIIGIDMGVTHVGVSMVNLGGEVKCWRQVEHQVRPDPQGTIERMKSLVDECITETNFSPERLVGIGISVPSPVDPGDPAQCLSPLILPHWKDYDLRQIFGHAYNTSIYVDNDANLGALAEHWWGAGKGGEHLAFVKIGSGIGAGLVFNGEIYRGARGMAGEIGHMIIDSTASQTLFGHKGGLVTLIGSEAIVENVQARLPEFPKSVLKSNGVSVRAVADAALADDPLARQVVRDVGYHLGIAVANLLNLFNPSIVVLGGAITQAGETLIEDMSEVVKERTLWESISDSKLLISTLGEQSISVGAATQVLHAALDDMSLFPLSRQATRR